MVKFARSVVRGARKVLEHVELKRVHRKYAAHTMIAAAYYVANLELVRKRTAALPMDELAVVECGVWRGGMTFGMLEALPQCRKAHMFDSFEGLPKPGPRDSRRVQELFDESLFVAGRNVASYEDVAESVGRFGFGDRVSLHKGWFEDTVSPDAIGAKIGVLRLDGDWYDSTKVVLDRLFDHVVPGGLLIIDDYCVWPGCARAVHDFLSERGAPEFLETWRGVVPYIVKRPLDVLTASVTEAERTRRRRRSALVKP